MNNIKSIYYSSTLDEITLVYFDSDTIILELAEGAETPVHQAMDWFIRSDFILIGYL